MYYITLRNRGNYIYIHRPSDPDRQVLSATLTYKLNEPESLVFTVPYNHPELANLTLGRYDVEIHKTDIGILPSSQITYTSPKLYARCRILRKSSNFDRSVTVECEGLLGCLNDTYIPPFTYAPTPSADVVNNFFSMLVGYHNTQINNSTYEYNAKTFRVNSSATTPTNYLGRSSTTYKSTMDSIKEHILDTQLGGYIYTVYMNKGITQSIYYIQDITTENTQTIEFGKNLLDLADELDATNLFTGVLAVGENEIIPDGTETLSSGFSWGTEGGGTGEVGDDKKVIYKDSLVALYGKKISVQEWSDVTLRTNLVKNAEALLNSTGIVDSLTLSAFDMSTIESADEWEIGKTIRVVSTPHNVSTTMALTEKTVDLLDPSQTTISLGKQTTRITDIRGNK